MPDHPDSVLIELRGISRHYGISKDQQVPAGLFAAAAAAAAAGALVAAAAALLPARMIRHLPAAQLLAEE